MRKDFVFVFISALWLACAPAATDTKKYITIGAILDRTGINSELSWGDAVALAQSHVNRALEEAGYKNLAFKVPVRDSAGVADAAIAESTKVVAEGAKALILASSDEDVAVHKLFYDADVSNDLNVPLICASCTSSSINSPTAVSTDLALQATYRNSNKWNARSVMSTKLIAKILARMIIKAGDTTGDGKLKVTGYCTDDSFGNGALKDIDAEMKLQLPLSTLTVPYLFEKISHPRDVDTNSYSWSGDVAKATDNFNETTLMTDGVPDMVVSANLVLQESAFTKAYNESLTTVPNLHMHTMRASSALRAIAQLAEGEAGVSHVLLDKSVSGDTFKADYESAFGTPVVYRDSIYYDAAMSILLATIQATMKLDDPTTVTGAQIHDTVVAMQASAAGGTVIRTGKDEVKKAITEMLAGRPINYEGASGPMDFDDNFNVRDRLARYRVVDGVFVDEAIFDCVASTDCPEVSQ